MSFEFLREGIVWLEYPTSTFYKLHTTKDVSFSQTFKQDEVQKRTLHASSDFIEDTVTNTAGPADFDFSIYLLKETLLFQHKPLDLLIDLTGSTLNTFNLYFVYQDYSPNIYYKIENCVFTNGTFNIPRAGLMTVSLSGQGTKLTRNAAPFSVGVGDWDSTPTFAVSKEFRVQVGGNYLDNILGASFEIQNDINWTKNVTLQETLAVTDYTDTIYPSGFTLNGRSMAGSINQYIDETNSQSNDNVLTWAEGTSVQIQAGLSASDYQIDISLPNASFTNRAAFGDIFTQSYDFRLTSGTAPTFIY